METVIEVTHPDGTKDTVVILENSVAAARCGIKFNPSEDRGVKRLKSLAAGFMQACDDYKASRQPDDGDGKRCFATAMTDAESAQMFAVKGLFTRRNAGKE